MPIPKALVWSETQFQPGFELSSLVHFLTMITIAPCKYPLIYIYIYIYIYKVKLANLVKGDLMAPFPIPTTPRCRGGHYGTTPFPGLLHFTLNTYLIIPSIKQGGIKYHFLSLWYDSTWDWTPVSCTIGKHSTH